MRQRGNQNFTRPEAIEPPSVTASSFEQVVKALNILPEEYESSPELKEWVRQNKDRKYAPPRLLEASGSFRIPAMASCWFFLRG